MIGGSRWICALALLAACSKDDAPPGQSFRDGVVAICGAGETEAARAAHPAERARVVAEQMRAGVTNPDARALVDRLDRLSMIDRASALREAVARAGVDRCPLLEEEGAARAEDGATVHVTAEGVVIDGQPLDADEIERFVAAHAAYQADRSRRDGRDPAPRFTIIPRDGAHHGAVLAVARAAFAAGARVLLAADNAPVPVAAGPAAPVAWAEGADGAAAIAAVVEGGERRVTVTAPDDAPAAAVVAFVAAAHARFPDVELSLGSP